MILGVYILKKNRIATIILGTTLSVSAYSQTLEQAIALTLANNPDIKSSFNEYMSNVEAHNSSGGAYLPSVDLSAGIGYENINEADSEGGGSSDMTRKDATLSLTQLIWDGSATINDIDRTAAEAESTRLQLLADAQDKALEVASVYLNVVKNQEILTLSEKNLEAHKQIFSDIKKRTDSGIGSTADLSQIEARLANANSNVLAAKNNLIDYQTQFLRIVGEHPRDLIYPKVNSNAIPSSLGEAKVLAEQSHPVLQVAKADIDAAKFQYEQSTGTNYPTFTIEAAHNWYDDASGVEGTRDETTAMLRMRYNLFNGGSDVANQERMAYQLNKAKDLRDLSYRTMYESLTLSWNALQLTHQQQKYLSSHVDAASNTANAYEKQYRIGQRTLLDVLNTENELFSARKAYLEANFDEQYAKYRVLNSIGILLDTLLVEIPEEWTQSIDY